jgi:hypothetical protein
LRGEGEGGEVSAVWGGGDVDVVGGWQEGWLGMGRRRLRGLGFLVPWLETEEEGSGFEACYDGGREDRP